MLCKAEKIDKVVRCFLLFHNYSQAGIFQCESFIHWKTCFQSSPKYLLIQIKLNKPLQLRRTVLFSGEERELPPVSWQISPVLRNIGHPVYSHHKKKMSEGIYMCWGALLVQCYKTESLCSGEYLFTVCFNETPACISSGEKKRGSLKANPLLWWNVKQLAEEVKSILLKQRMPY